MTLRAIDVHGFGGGFTLATVQAGFELVAKKSREVGFGVYNCLGNRALLGDKWEAQSEPPAQWEPHEAELVVGNPPCSGFSTLSRADFRGENSSINECMWELQRYASKVRPRMVIFESVQQTFKQGIKLMRRLHTALCEETGIEYGLTHVLHNNLSHGGVSNRRRYFWVAWQPGYQLHVNTLMSTRFDYRTNQLHVEPLQYVPKFGDMLLDLEPVGMSMQEQPYSATQTMHDPDDDAPVWSHVVNSARWSREQAHDGTGRVDGHITNKSPYVTRMMEAAVRLANDGWHWPERARAADVLREYHRRYGKLPDSFNYLTKVADSRGLITKAERLLETDFAMGHNQLARWKWDAPANVITGGAVHLVLHPRLLRTLTQREAARIQGFPDAWKIWPVRNAPDLGPAWGKGVPVQSGRWIAHYARKSIEGDVSEAPDAGVPMTAHRVGRLLVREHGAYARTNELVIDSTNAWKRLVTE